VRDKWLIQFAHLRKGGLAFYGVDPLTGDRTECLCFKPNYPISPDRKYENPRKALPQAIYPAVTYRIWKLVSDRFGVQLPPDLTIDDPSSEAKNFWLWVIDNNIPVIPTEGAKKAMGTISQGFPAIALTGFWNGAPADRDESGKTTSYTLIPTLLPIATPDRVINIAFDRDKKASANKDVIQARSVLAKLLIERGSKPFSIPWDNDYKGLDDLIANCGIEALEKAIEKAEELTGEKPNFKQKPAPNILAEKIAKELKNKLLFDVGGKLWRYYDGGVWYEKTIEEIERYFYERVCLDVPENIPSYIENVVKVAKWKLLQPKWDEVSGLEYIPFKNGVWDVKNRKLLPHSSDFLLTWKLTRDYPSVIGLEYQNIDRFLNEITNKNQKLKDILIAACNAVILGRSDLQKAIYLVGSGGNGKGSFLRLLEMLVGGENTHSTTLQDICENNFELANIYKKRLIVCPDEDKRVGGLSRFKSITGGDSIRGEKKGKDAFRFRYEGMVAIASNDPIFLGDSSYGLSRRLITIPFKYQVPVSQRRDLEAEFTIDLPAFTSYLLSLDNNWVKSTLLGSSEVAEIRDTEWDLTTRTDSIAGFCDDSLIFDPSPEVKTSTSMLYSAYQDYCKASGLSAKSIHKFTPDLVDLCSIKLGLAVIAHRSNKGRNIVGLRFRSESDACDAWCRFQTKASPPSNPPGDEKVTLVTLSNSHNGKNFLKEELNSPSDDKKTKDSTEHPQSVTSVTLGSSTGLESVTPSVTKRHQASQASLKIGDRVENKQTGERGVVSQWYRDRSKATIKLDNGDLTDWISVRDLQAAAGRKQHD
jgi:putative DNA primase/helicase